MDLKREEMAGGIKIRLDLAWHKHISQTLTPGRLTNRLRIKTLIAFAFANAFISCSAEAHPHSWIALTSEFILDDRGYLAEIRQRWDFDAFYSMMTLADVMNEFRDKNSGLQNMATTMVRNLASYQYFSTLMVNRTEIPLVEPEHYQLQTVTEEGQQILSLNMHFRIAPSLGIEGKTITWSVFDPTYYIDMAHRDTTKVVIHGGNATECSKQIELPNPSDDIIEYASSLDQTKRIPKDLEFTLRKTSLLDAFREPIT
jgi:ABC-type uncharacterized transport system substrate-binding protein